MSKFGEWFWCGDSLMENRVDHSVHVLCLGRDGAFAPSTADAARISAVPDLLTAAKAALATHSLIESEKGLPSLADVAIMLRAAIAKAEGSQQ